MHLLIRCVYILFGGAYKTPITPYLLHAPKELIIADPLIEAAEWNEWNGKPSKIRHWNRGLDKLDLDYFVGRPFGFVACGVDLTHPDGNALGYLDVVCRFLCMISRSQVAVPST